MPSNAFSRRGALATGAAALAASRIKPLRAQNKTDVVVIGAGLSGLNAAMILEEQGFSVQVIEGRDRIGGRLHSLHHIPGSPEAGGNTIGTGYGRMVDILDRLDIPYMNVMPRAMKYAYELYMNGDRITTEQWKTHPKNILPEEYKALPPWAVGPTLMGRTNQLESFEDWYDPKSAPYDISVYEVLKGLGLNDEQIALAFELNISYGTSAHDVSALMMWFNDGWINSMRDGGPVQWAAIGGNMNITEAMAGALQNEVHLGREVSGIRSSDTGAEVVCRDGTVYRADFVVCSIPMPILRYVGFDPFLPGPQAKAIRTVPYFPMTQVHFTATEPFWEADGNSPEMWTDTVAGHVIANMHDVDDDDEITSFTAWARGHTAVRLDQIDRKDAQAWVISEIERIRPAAKGKIEARYIKSWVRDPFAGGDYAIWGPGQVTEFISEVGKPHGRIHFCGEHTALSNRGMEGAMESGERAAFDILSEA